MKPTVILLDELTTIACVVLILLAVWTVAHGSALLRDCLQHRTDRRYRTLASRLTHQLDVLAEQISHLSSILKLPSSADHTAYPATQAGCQQARARLRLVANVDTTLVAEARRTDTMFADLLEEVLRRPRSSSMEISQATGEQLNRHWRRFRQGLLIAAAAAPPAGAAPTMSGSMSWLTRLSTHVGQAGVAGAIPLDGLGAALMTTYAGCLITVTALTFHFIARWRFDSAHAVLTECVKDVLEHRRQLGHVCTKIQRMLTLGRKGSSDAKP